MSVSGQGYGGRLAALAALVGIYAAGTQSVLFAPEGGTVASWWPAAGIAVALIALAPRPWWPLLALGIVIASGAANVTGGRPLDVAAMFGLSNAAEAVVAGLVLRRRVDSRPRLEFLDDFLRLLRAAVLGAA
ncbi:MAG: MASE1 domain-containing protein, partial [Nocardioides sp.]